VKEGPIFDSRELDDDVRVEYDKDGQIAGIEVLNSREFFRTHAEYDRRFGYR
jgi:uncharacterized protein YuzE